MLAFLNGPLGTFRFGMGHLVASFVSR
ncbi:protein of unknown function [Shinella sp. WSC3-e]|nr:protein of unknown function [Shinella sp. WSC3-e]